MDSELESLIRLEEQRQNECINLIASENFTSTNVKKCLSSVLTNKYSEGYPRRRYYGGNQFIDQIEELCQKRALTVFKTGDDWGVNVQSYSGSVANMAVYLGLLNLHDKIMGLGLTSGGHLTHGAYTTKRCISHTSKLFCSLPYSVGSDGWVDYDDLEKNAKIFCPKLIICGGSAYSRDWDYVRLRQIADDVGAYLMADISHISAFVATGLMKSPFEHCDVVTTTTHKSLRGPRAALIFYHLKYKQLIDNSLFPGLQGGPHNNKIAAIASQLHEVQTPEFRKYIWQVRENAQVLGHYLKMKGYDVLTGGTDCHILLINLRNKGVSGSKFEYLAEKCNVIVNKNTVPGDKNAFFPSGVRLGLSAVTTRGITKIKELANHLDGIVLLTKAICNDKPMKMKEFQEECEKYFEEIEMMRKTTRKLL